WRRGRTAPARVRFCACRGGSDAVGSKYSSRLLQHVRDLVETEPATREERDLLLHETTGLGVAQVAHEVDELGDVIGLEREDPLVVAEGEGRDGVRDDALERRALASVIRQHLAAVLLR